MVVPEGFEILSNGLYKHQWDWLKEFGAAKQPRMDGAEVQRQAVQWFMDAIMASTSGPVATPEQDYDYAELIQKQSKKSVRSKTKPKQVKQKINKE